MSKEFDNLKEETKNLLQAAFKIRPPFRLAGLDEFVDKLIDCAVLKVKEELQKEK